MTILNVTPDPHPLVSRQDWLPAQLTTQFQNQTIRFPQRDSVRFMHAQVNIAV